MSHPPPPHPQSAETPDRPPRIIAEFRSTQPGPTIIILTAIHGNEPSGTEAFQRVAAQLNHSSNTMDLCGECIGIIGNRRASARNQRAVHHDLNRAWTSRNISRVKSLTRSQLQLSAPSEDFEQFELLNVINEITARADKPIYFFDLHTTSAESKPFVLLGDTLRNRAFARNFPIPILLGLEEQIDGTITEWMTAQGYVSIGFEAGRHADPDSVDRHEAGIWIALVAAGLLKPNAIPSFEQYCQILTRAADDLPQFIEVRYRHGITDDSKFQMIPGFENFVPIQKGQPLADDCDGVVESPEDGRILLPLYQKIGADGFFICRDVKPIWLKISRILRRLRAHRLAPLFPGVRRCPNRPGTLIVNSKVARWLANEVFHLLGYRKIRAEKSDLIVSRRRFDYE